MAKKPKIENIKSLFEEPIKAEPVKINIDEIKLMPIINVPLKQEVIIEQKKPVLNNDFAPLSEEMRKKLFPTFPPLTLKQLKAKKNGK